MTRRTILVLSAAVLVLSACGGGGEAASSGSTSPTVPGARAITLLSGEDPLPTYTIGNGRAAGQTGEARVQGCASNWYTMIEDTQWVSVTRRCRKSHASARRAFGRGVYTDYSLTFRLPQGFTSPSISVLVVANDAAEVFLNGTSLGAQPTGKDHWKDNANGDPWLITSEEASAFRSGVNKLGFRVTDIAGDTGLDFSATITYLP